MNSPQTRLPFRFQDATLALKKRWRWIAVSAVLSGAVGLAYAASLPPVWESTQATVLRDEAIGDLARQGRFESADALKTAQETVLQVARQRETLAAALAEVGPPPAYLRFEPFPTDGEVEAFADEVTVSPPKGLEFGKSEVIYVTVQAANAIRASKLVRALCDRIDLDLRELRRERASEIIAEMTRTRELASSELAEATGKLNRVEQEVGSDLGELRVLNELGGGESNLRTSLNQIRAEIRQVEADRTAKEELRRILESAKSNPEVFAATPAKLLESQPALTRLKEGLVDAQLRRATLVGRLNPEHPELLAAVAAEKETRRNVLGELDGAILGLANETRVVQASLDDLRRQEGEVEGRLSKLASMRADYGNLVAIVRQRGEALQLADKKLSDAKASYAAASSARLLTTMGPPSPSDGPVGLGKTKTAFAAALLGAFACAGVIVLATPLERVRGRRATDYLPPHLRPAERNTGRRGADRTIDPVQVAALSPTQTSHAAPTSTPSESSSRGRRAADHAAGPYAGPDRRVGDRRQTPAPAVEEKLAPITDAPNEAATIVEPKAEKLEPIAAPLVSVDDGETCATSSLLDNLRKQIDLLRESTVIVDRKEEARR